MNQPTITPELVASHGLKPDEYERILKLIGRVPSFTELGIFSAMWNEHCSYKSSRLHLRGLPTKAPWVIQGPGENAGVIDIGDGQAVVFKMESHNHPSYIEPYQGATTGVGGILRDVFTMGARPIACLNALSFGAPEHPKTRHLVSGVVAGVGGYGNSFGVPTVGGQVRFHTRYDGNILVNAMAVGLADADKIFYAAASGVEHADRLFRLQDRPRRHSRRLDGVGRIRRRFRREAPDRSGRRSLRGKAAAGSLPRDHGSRLRDRDPGHGRGGADLFGGRNGRQGRSRRRSRSRCGADRETGMSAYEMMLSESQERMLMVLKPEKEKQAEAIFRKWGLDFAVVGYTTPSKRFVVKHGGDVMADLPIKELGDEAPLYDRPHVRNAAVAGHHARDVKPPSASAAALEKLIATPELCSKRWVWEQYDHVILGNTVQRPGGDAAVVRVQDGPKGLALTVDVTPRYCEADPFRRHAGGGRSLAQYHRGRRRPLAITDNLNFGNPERPEIMGQFVGCLKGIAEACRALDFPVVSGNVSLYNETNGRGILPTPSIGGVGLLDDFTKSATLAFKAADEAILLIGETQGWLGQSVYLRDICGREEGAPPPVDLAAEKRNGDVVRGMIHAGTATAAHDVSDGGLLIALAEMAIASGIGAQLLAAPGSIVPHAYWYGEDQARYIVTVPAEEAGLVLAKMKGAGVPCVRIGTTGGDAVAVAGETPVTIASLKAGFEGWFPAYMGGAN